jgi:FO synthase
MLRAGINDFGGISPVTPDYINPRHPWPHLDALQEGCAREGFTLRARLPIYDRWRDDDDFLDAGLRDATRVSAGTLARFTASGAAETTQGVVACAT